MGGFFGSQAFTDNLRPEEIPKFRDSNHQRITDAMARYGLDASLAPRAYRQPREIRAYVKLHIEQGLVLESEGMGPPHPAGLLLTAFHSAFRIPHSALV